MFKWIALKLRIAELQKTKQLLQIEIAELNAKFAERSLLKDEWNQIHIAHQNTIDALLDAIKNRK
jgi:Tfp pilus assembly protein PilN